MDGTTSAPARARRRRTRRCEPAPPHAGQTILDTVDWTVRAGKHWALLGPPDGAGKTSVLRLVGHTTFPTTGTVEVLGHRLGRVDVRELRQGGEQAAGGHGRILPVNPDTGWQLGDLASALRTRRRTEREPVVPITVPSTELAVFELRQYTLRPGRREELIELFDREFVESQEECGAAVVGQFRDLDDPDRFVWRRGFRDIAVRHEALAAFYGGPVWAEHGPAANATMADSDDVLLLRPLVEGGGPAVEPSGRPRAGSPAPDRFVSALVWSFPPGGRRDPRSSGTVSCRPSGRRGRRRWPPHGDRPEHLREAAGADRRERRGRPHLVPRRGGPGGAPGRTPGPSARPRGDPAGARAGADRASLALRLAPTGRSLLR